MAGGGEAQGCQVRSCNNPAHRSLSTKKLRESLPELDIDETARRTRLCKAHYKQYKKKTRKERTLERLGW